MKKKWSSYEYRTFNKRNALNRLKRRMRTNYKRRIKKRLRIGKNKEQIAFENSIKGLRIVKVPSTFAFLQNPEEVIKVIQILESALLNKEKVFLNVKNLTIIDYGAITVLLSVMFNFKAKKVFFKGNFPEKPFTRDLLVNSGFFKYLTKPLGDKIEYTIGKPNQMFTQANKMVVAELGKPIMEETGRTIWGEERMYKGLQRVLVELMQNTNNHAALNEKGRERWWLSVNHNKELKKVSFVFVDYGVGVFESLSNKPSNSKWYNAISNIMEKFKTNDKVLKSLLNGELHLTVTGQHFRGKGLPGIYEVQNKNQISKLHIITNNVFADVQNENYSILRNPFAGTFVYWEINQLNENMEWKI